MSRFFEMSSAKSASASEFAHRLDTLNTQLRAFLASEQARNEDYDEDREDPDPEEDRSQPHSRFLTIMGAICSVVRDAAAAEASDLDSIIVDVDHLFNEVMSLSYQDLNMFDFAPSFAHCDQFPLVEDAGRALFGGHGVMTKLLPFLKEMIIKFGKPGTDLSILPKPAAAWSTTKRPHPKSTRLSRFRDFTAWTPDSSTPIATAVYEARCEITSLDINAPVQMTLSSGGSCLAVTGTGGWKQRSPMLTYFLLNEDDEPESHFVQPGLADIAYHSTIDEQRKLILLADSARIKSYAWGAVNGGENYEDPLPTHTMDTDKFEGPLVMLSGDRLIRAGRGSAGVWNLDTLPTHGPTGRARVGSKIKNSELENTWRDDPEEIERSRGVPATTTLTFEDSALSPGKWHSHPSSQGVMLCTGDLLQQMSCLALDLEHGGKISTRYLGHGGDIDDFSTSTADPNAFATAASDSFARLFDIRQPLPVMTFNAQNCDGACSAVQLAHPDGIPTIFTGSQRGEHVKLWDVRARSVIYELATGNNSVSGLTWNPSNNTLYAATECIYMDRHGCHHDYRKAKAPKPVVSDEGGAESEWEDMDDDDDMEDDDDDDDYDRCWPTSAYHAEDSFGYMFDAGDHFVFRYSFKENADPEVLPEYGQATIGDSWY